MCARGVVKSWSKRELGSVWNSPAMAIPNATRGLFGVLGSRNKTRRRAILSPYNKSVVNKLPLTEVLSSKCTKTNSQFYNSYRKLILFLQF